jgi:membrane associated rhomboid family serine protease
LKIRTIFDRLWVDALKTSEIIELIASGIMIIGLLCLTIHRVALKKGIGARVIQYLAVILIVPGILILALEKVFAPETTAALFGAITGYLLSGIGEFKPRRSERGQQPKQRDSESRP